MPPSKLNPDALPLGFTKDIDPESKREYLGFTCAACHTSKLALAGKEVLIDGGPTLADFKKFLHELNTALEATLNEQARFERFAAHVLGPAASNDAKQKLHDDVQQGSRSLLKRETADKTEVPYGYARLDAFGGILNNVAVAGLKLDANAAPPDAPVSYPFIWDAPQADRVQWNGAALNAPVLGGLIRNIGEVLGVFGRLEIEPASKLSLDKGYDNSVNLENLGQLENWLKELWSPAWPAEYLPAIDQALASQGRSVYDAECVGCHTRLESRNPARKFKAVMTPLAEIGTDPTMATNYLERRAATGVLEGERLMVLSGPKLGKEARTFNIVINGVSASVVMIPDCCARSSSALISLRTVSTLSSISIVLRASSAFWSTNLRPLLVAVVQLPKSLPVSVAPDTNISSW
jgi:mono/diheme cytochrome c family protein